MLSGSTPRGVYAREAFMDERLDGDCWAILLAFMVWAGPNLEPVAMSDRLFRKITNQVLRVLKKAVEENPEGLQDLMGTLSLLQAEVGGTA